MKNLWSMIFVSVFCIGIMSSAKAFSDDCSLSVYAPGTPESFATTAMKALESKGYGPVTFVSELNDVDTKYILELRTQGVFNFQYIASATLVTSSETIVEKFSKRTLGQSDTKIFNKLIRRMSDCQDL